MTRWNWDAFFSSEFMFIRLAWRLLWKFQVSQSSVSCCLSYLFCFLSHFRCSLIQVSGHQKMSLPIFAYQMQTCSGLYVGFLSSYKIAWAWEPGKYHNLAALCFSASYSIFLCTCMMSLHSSSNIPGLKELLSLDRVMA